MEEIEHKGVAYDVMQKVAKVGYFTRILSMIHTTFGLPLHTFLIMAYMLRVDGFGFWQRAGIWLRGLWWLYRPGGLYMPLMGHYFAYYLPGYHPWKTGQMRSYQRWLAVFNSTGNPIAAGDELYVASS
jgi:uncharacterized protein